MYNIYIYIYNVMIRDNHMDIDLTWLIAGGDGSWRGVTSCWNHACAGWWFQSFLYMFLWGCLKIGYPKIWCLILITPGSEYMAQTYFFRGGCAIYLTVIFFKDMYPKQQKCPEDGATLHVQNGPNCAIYPIFNLNPFFRDRTFRSSKRWKNNGDVCSTIVFLVFFHY